MPQRLYRMNVFCNSLILHINIYIYLNDIQEVYCYYYYYYYYLLLLLLLQ
jgi:hypothetical protein